MPFQQRHSDSCVASHYEILNNCKAVGSKYRLYYIELHIFSIAFCTVIWIDLASADKSLRDGFVQAQMNENH